MRFPHEILTLCQNKYTCRAWRDGNPRLLVHFNYGLAGLSGWFKAHEPKVLNQGGNGWVSWHEATWVVQVPAFRLFFFWAIPMVQRTTLPYGSKNACADRIPKNQDQFHGKHRKIRFLQSCFINAVIQIPEMNVCTTRWVNNRIRHVFKFTCVKHQHDHTAAVYLLRALNKVRVRPFFRHTSY